MSWQEYFEKTKARAVRPLYNRALELGAFQDVTRLTAVDLGCGAGIEVADLLRRGWNVLAIDCEPAAISAVNMIAQSIPQHKLETICSRFEDLTEIPQSDFLYSYHALPFCNPGHFDRICNLVSASIKPNGIFCGSFFGPDDEWVESGHTIGVTPERLSHYFREFEILHSEEIKQLGQTALNGAKYWHYIEIICRKRS